MFAPMPDNHEFWMRERRQIAARAESFLASKGIRAFISPTPHGNNFTLKTVKNGQRIDKVYLNALDLWRRIGELAS